MTRFLTLATIAALLCACSRTPADKLIGEWKGTDSTGNTASVLFNRDRTFRMVQGNLVIDGPTLGGKAEWRIDSSHDPMSLDIIITPPSGEQTTLPMIARFITDQKLQLRASPDMRSRPTAFSAEDTQNQIIVVKQ